MEMRRSSRRTSQPCTCWCSSRRNPEGHPCSNIPHPTSISIERIGGCDGRTDHDINRGVGEIRPRVERELADIHTFVRKGTVGNRSKEKEKAYAFISPE